MWFPYVNWESALIYTMDRQTLCFTVANFVYVVFYVLFLVRQKFFSRKTAGRITFSILVFIFPLEAFQSSFSLCRSFSKHSHKEIACFFPTIGGDGSRQYCSGAAIFIRLLQYTAIFCSSFKYCRKFATVKQRVWRSNTFLTTVFKTVLKYVFNTFSSPRGLLFQNGAFSLQFFEKVVLKVIVAKICNGKTKGLAILM